MDNASNNDTLTRELAVLVPGFRGADARTRCLAHIVNLMAKVGDAFISFFFLQPKRKKKTKIKKNPAKKRKRGQPEPVRETEETVEVNIEGDELTGDKALDDLALETARDDDVELATHTGTGTTENLEQPAEHGKTVHDKAVVRSIKQQAIIAAKALGIEIPPDEEKTALGIFPKAAGAARRVRDSAPLREQFDLLLAAQNKTDKLIPSDAKVLRPREPTRWNCNFDCLATHIVFRPVVEKLTAGAQNELNTYAMSEKQWELGDEIIHVLAIFDLVTDLFSKKEVPLVHQTGPVPVLEDIERRLKCVVNQERGPVPAVIRVAAQAAILVQNKYYHLTGECEVYQIALILCPDKKLKWFTDNNRSADEIEEARKTITHQFNESYNKNPA
ncbi:hypothetical protein BOTBODRAFT_84535, partial [Botryobasidium botryosum FD-172 SS1]